MPSASMSGQRPPAIADADTRLRPQGGARGAGAGRLLSCSGPGQVAPLLWRLRDRSDPGRMRTGAGSPRRVVRALGCARRRAPPLDSQTAGLGRERSSRRECPNGDEAGTRWPDRSRLLERRRGVDGYGTRRLCLRIAIVGRASRTSACWRRLASLPVATGMPSLRMGTALRCCASRRKDHAGRRGNSLGAWLA